LSSSAGPTSSLARSGGSLISSDVAIRIKGLAKAYRIKHQEQQITLAEQALQRLRHPLHRAPTETFWALSGIDLEISRGGILGLIGRNGAGKSTLLKILSRITAPTEGRVDVYGRIGSLLEVGTGFHPELTGRENVYLNGSILGMRKREIDRQFDAIVEFAGVERFLDTPVKRYSSGMYVRLAFAVAAHLETEILLIDEVLAVGDQEFQEKCIGKMRDVTTAGRTVILVSHNLATVKQLADRCVLLDLGAIAAEGAVAHVLDEYRGAASQAWARNGSSTSSGLQRAAQLVRVELVGSATVVCGQPLVFDVEAVINSDHATRMAIGVTIRSMGAAIGVTHGEATLTPGSHECTARISVSTDQLAPGQYTFSLAVGAVSDRGAPAADDVVQDVLAVDLVATSDNDWLLRNWHPSFGAISFQSTTTLRLPSESRE
jgi:lipopolysaccharide transport system ATP-binding protein